MVLYCIALTVYRDLLYKSNKVMFYPFMRKINWMLNLKNNSLLYTINLICDFITVQSFTCQT